MLKLSGRCWLAVGSGAAVLRLINIGSGSNQGKGLRPRNVLGEAPFLQCSFQLWRSISADQQAGVSCDLNIREFQPIYLVQMLANFGFCLLLDDIELSYDLGVDL